MEDYDTSNIETDIDDDDRFDSDDDWIENLTDDSNEDDDHSEYSTVSDEDGHSEYSTASKDDELSSDFDDEDCSIKIKHEILRQNVVILGSKPNEEISKFFKSFFSSEYSFYNNERSKTNTEEINTEEYTDEERQEENNTSFNTSYDSEITKSIDKEQAITLNTNQDEPSGVICLHCEKIFENKQALIDHLVIVAKDKDLPSKEQEFIKNESSDGDFVNDLEFQDSNPIETQEQNSTHQITKSNKKVTIVFEDDDNVNDESFSLISETFMDTHRCKNKSKRRIDDYITTKFAMRCVKPSKKLKFE